MSQTPIQQAKALNDNLNVIMRSIMQEISGLHGEIAKHTKIANMPDSPVKTAALAQASAKVLQNLRALKAVGQAALAEAGTITAQIDAIIAAMEE